MKVKNLCLRCLAKVVGHFPEQIMNLRMKKAMGRKLQNPPHSFYDKIFWLSFHSDTSAWTLLADKYEVRKYVKNKCTEELLPRLYGVYKSSTEINYEVLPDSFVVKTTNGCGTNYIVHNKKDICPNTIRKKVDNWLTFPYGELTGQPHYQKIIPRIIIEELLYNNENDSKLIDDYKFYCFHGKPMYCEVISDRKNSEKGFKHGYSIMLYDMNGNTLPQYYNKGVSIKNLSLPDNFSKMEEVAEKLSEGFPFVRVDLYNVCGKIKFGEMTFTPGGMQDFTEEFQKILGDLI